MGKLLFVLFILLTTEAMVVALVVSDRYVISQMEQEQANLAAWLGEVAANRMATETREDYTRYFVDTGAIESLRDFFLPRDRAKDIENGTGNVGRPFFPYVEDRLNAFWYTMFQILLRLKQFEIWMPLLYALLLPAIVDGWNTREMKLHSYGYSSPNLYHMAFHVVILLLFMVVVYLLSPVAWPAWLVPMWMGAIALAALMMTSHFQKMF